MRIIEEKYEVVHTKKFPSVNSRLHRNKARKKSVEWLCNNCGNVLGRVTNGNTILHIKYKDFYCDIMGSGAVVVTRCIRCGTQQDMGPQKPSK